MNPSRSVLIAGNWKMNHGPRATREFAAALSKLLPDGRFFRATGAVEACLYVPAVSLSAALESLTPLGIRVGAENAHFKEFGAFTGEISGPMLKEIGIQDILIGHSERRQYFGETDSSAGERMTSLLAQGFRVTFCVGETQAERERGETEQVLRRQIQGAFAVLKASPGGVSTWNPTRAVIAYEPVWAIGTGLTATPDQAEDAHRIVRALLSAELDSPTAERTRILYGGSVTPENISALLSQPDVDGALVGGASLKPDSYFRLITAQF